MKYNVNSIYLCNIYQVFDVILNRKEDTTTFIGSFVKKALVYRTAGYFVDLNTGEKVCSVFYCDPNCSWQKGSIEKNHEFIRYILPKGTSFASITQEDCYLISSHINSTPRLSLNNNSPYDSIILFLGKDNINKLNIKKI